MRSFPGTSSLCLLGTGFFSLPLSFPVCISLCIFFYYQWRLWLFPSWWCRRTKERGILGIWLPMRISPSISPSIPVTFISWCYRLMTRCNHRGVRVLSFWLAFPYICILMALVWRSRWLLMHYHRWSPKCNVRYIRIIRI